MSNLLKYIIFIVGFFYQNTYSQTFESKLVVCDSLNYDLKVYRLETQYLIEFNSISNNNKKVKQVVSSFNEEILYSVMRNKLLADSLVLSSLDSQKLQVSASKKYLEALIGMFDEEEGMPIAKITVYDSVNLYSISSDNGRKNIIGVAKVNKCKILFQDGFIKSIMVYTEFKNKNYVFSNNYSIGITTRNNIRKLSKVELSSELDVNNRYFVIVSELINYDREIPISTNDFSPKIKVWSLLLTN